MRRYATMLCYRMDHDSCQSFLALQSLQSQACMLGGPFEVAAGQLLVDSRPCTALTYLCSYRHIMEQFNLPALTGKLGSCPGS